MIYRIWDTKENKYFINVCGKSFWGREENAIRASTRLWMEKGRFVVHKFKLTRLED